MTGSDTVFLSLAGSALVAALPKLIDLLLGERVARRKTELEQEAAYRQRVFEDATAVRMERAAIQAGLERRCAELEEENRRLKEKKAP